MDKPTAILSAEHKNILKMIDVLMKECDLAAETGEINRDFFEKAIDFIKNYADKFHHAKEEDILFVEFCKAEDQFHCNPTEQMLYEHNLGRDFVKGMVAGLSEGNPDKLIDNARGYACLLRDHIAKEDNILYPMIDEHFNEATQNTILEKFKAAEKNRFNQGEKEKYLALFL